MSEIIGDEMCPACRENGHDSQGNHLICFEDGGKVCKKSEYHTSQQWYVENPEEDYRETDMSITDLPSADLLSRGIRKDIAVKYGVKVEYNSQRQEVKYYYPEVVNDQLCTYRVRELPKRFFSVGAKLKGKEVELWGQRTCTQGKKLLITEGMDDAMAAHQMLFDRYPKYPPNVVGNAGTGAKRVADNLDFVLSFEEVILCLDPDKAGEDGTKKLISLIGPKAKVMKISDDPNQMLLDNKQDEFIRAFFNAEVEVPSGILSVNDVYDKAIAMPTWGRKWPWPTLDRYTYGRREGSGIYVGAGVKAGKTEWLSQMVNYISEVEQRKSFLFKFEQPPEETVKALAGKRSHINFSKPDGNFTQEDLINAVQSVNGKIYMYDASYSDVGVSNLWDRMKPAIRHAVLVLGIKDIFIDPITQLTDGMTPSDTETELRRFSNELAGMAQDFGFFYYCFCHLKEPPSTAKSHEEGGKVKVAQFRGSRAMAEKTKLMLGITRNQQADDEVERNTSTFSLLLNSGFGRTGSFPVYYDENTGDYLEADPNEI